MLARVLLVTIALAAGACSGTNRTVERMPEEDPGLAEDPGWAPGDSVGLDHAFPALWVFPGSDVPAFCFELHPDGTGGFFGGFTWLNPFRWKVDRTGRLAITFTDLTAAEHRVLRYGETQGRFAAFDSATGTVTQHREGAKTQVHLFGYVLRPVDLLEDYEIDYARENCVPLRARREGP